jgi:hypothetical protein
VPAEVALNYCRLEKHDVENRVLTKVATVAFCLRDLPLREALSIGDSAVRKGVPIEEIRHRVRQLGGRGAAQARRRAELLDGRAANAFESCTRAILIEAGIAGFATHGTLEAMTADCTRHTNLTAAGWRSLRVTWYQVNFHPDWVLQRVRDTMTWAGTDARSA